MVFGCVIFLCVFYVILVTFRAVVCNIVFFVPAVLIRLPAEYIIFEYDIRCFFLTRVDSALISAPV